MAGLNKIQIIGRLGQDVEVKYSQASMAVANFSVATSDSWADKTTGEKQERTEWHKIVCFGKLAENCGKYLSKGRQCYVEGKLQTSSYEKDGQTHYSTKIIADNVIFLGESSSNNTQQSQGGYQPQAQTQPQPKQCYQPTPQQQKVAEQMGEEIPF